MEIVIKIKKTKIVDNPLIGDIFKCYNLQSCTQWEKELW